MHIEVTGNQLEVTPALRERVERKLHKIEHKSHVIEAHVTLKVLNKHEQHAHARVNIKGHHVESSATTEDMYKAIDEVMDKVERQIIKHKEKEQSK